VQQVRAGDHLANAQHLLRSFAAFAADRQQPYIRTATVIDWASRAPSSAQRHNRYQTVRQFAEYVHLEDHRHDLPLPNHFGPRKTRRVPRIYTAAQINRLILAATQLSAGDDLRPQTYATLISLLVATGLRISEALHLYYGDVTPDGLLIRKTKFQKTRLVPLHETAVAELGRYLAQRGTAYLDTDPVFADNNGQPLKYGTVYGVFGRHCAVARPSPTAARAQAHVCLACAAVNACRAANGSDSTCWLWPPISAT
jgi:integrase